jgi:hypothetical protein
LDIFEVLSVNFGRNCFIELTPARAGEDEGGPGRDHDYPEDLDCHPRKLPHPGQVRDNYELF